MHQISSKSSVPLSSVIQAQNAPNHIIDACISLCILVHIIMTRVMLSIRGVIGDIEFGSVQSTKALSIMKRDRHVHPVAFWLENVAARPRNKGCDDQVI